MKIELKQITIKEVADGYKNNDEEGVVGYGSKLNIRPKYHVNLSTRMIKEMR